VSHVAFLNGCLRKCCPDPLRTVTQRLLDERGCLFALKCLGPLHGERNAPKMARAGLIQVGTLAYSRCRYLGPASALVESTHTHSHKKAMGAVVRRWPLSADAFGRGESFAVGPSFVAAPSVAEGRGGFLGARSSSERGGGGPKTGSVLGASFMDRKLEAGEGSDWDGRLAHHAAVRDDLFFLADRRVSRMTSHAEHRCTRPLWF
jgi:hypothetical protein